MNRGKEAGRARVCAIKRVFIAEGSEIAGGRGEGDRSE